jgi:hypothetical protein
MRAVLPPSTPVQTKPRSLAEDSNPYSKLSSKSSPTAIVPSSKGRPKKPRERTKRPKPPPPSADDAIDTLLTAYSRLSHFLDSNRIIILPTQLFRLLRNLRSLPLDLALETTEAILSRYASISPLPLPDETPEELEARRQAVLASAKGIETTWSALLARQDVSEEMRKSYEGRLGPGLVHVCVKWEDWKGLGELSKRLRQGFEVSEETKKQVRPPFVNPVFLASFLS